MASSACTGYYQWLPSSVQLQPQGNNLLLPSSEVTTEHYGLITLPWQQLFPTLIALKGGHIQGSLLYQCTLNQLKVSLGEGLNSSALLRTLNSPHPNRPLTITYTRIAQSVPLIVWLPGLQSININHRGHILTVNS